MDKEKTIQIIKERIISEHRKHKTIDWEEITARKIYATVVKLFALADVNHQRELLKAFQDYYQSDKFDDERTFDWNIDNFLKPLIERSTENDF